MNDNISIDVYSCAFRGRYPYGIKTVQILEINKTGFSNSITSVAKDSLILEIVLENIKQYHE